MLIYLLNGEEIALIFLNLNFSQSSVILKIAKNANMNEAEPKAALFASQDTFTLTKSAKML